MDKTVNVVGLGYIGLPTALMLSASGICVTGTDIEKKKIDTLRLGETTFEEDGLDKLFGDACRNGIEFTTACIAADVYIIAVPTPYNKRTRKVVADYLVKAVSGILPLCKAESIIVIESTVSPGTIETHIRPLVNKVNIENKKRISLAHAPERIIPGNMISELRNNCRVIGADNKEVGRKIKSLYESFCQGDIIITDIKTAELTKVAENTYRDINIAYANELVKICKEAGVNVYELIRLANMHPRVNILKPGPGVGGHCISVDPWFLVGDYPEIANLILTSRKVNDSMPEYVLNRISEIMKENSITDIRDVGLYGLTYKENVDDLRESPTLQLIKCMESHAVFGVKVYDPYIVDTVVPNQYHDLGGFLAGIKLAVIMVGHDEIIQNEGLLSGHTVFDTRNVIQMRDKYVM